MEHERYPTAMRTGRGLEGVVGSCHLLPAPTRGSAGDTAGASQLAAGEEPQSQQGAGGGGSPVLAQCFPFNVGAASAPSFGAYLLRTARREACLAEINRAVLARAALGSVLLTFLMTSLFWLGRRAYESSLRVQPWPCLWSGSGCMAKHAWPSQGGIAPLVPLLREGAQRSLEL